MGSSGTNERMRQEAGVEEAKEGETTGETQNPHSFQNLSGSAEEMSSASVKVDDDSNVNVNDGPAVAGCKFPVSTEALDDSEIEEEYKTGRQNKHIDFRKTRAYTLIREFLFRIDLSIKTEDQEEPREPDPYLDTIVDIIHMTPLSSEPSRYANAGMKDVIRKVCLLTRDRHLRHSFGNLIRMDFGTGHELNFLCYLYKRHVGGHLRTCEVSSVLKKYFRAIREYVKKFNVEAAGARGCWSLDDYMLLPYLFGSSENFERTEYCGSSEAFSAAGFREAWDTRSPSRIMDIITQRGWKEMNVGLIKMYEEEVLGKRVVTQHFIYCEELPVS